MAQPADSPAGLTNLQKRILSAAVLLPLVVVEIILGHPYFDGLVARFAGVMAWEWARICARRRNPADPAPASTPPRSERRFSEIRSRGVATGSASTRPPAATK